MDIFCIYLPEIPQIYREEYGKMKHIKKSAAVLLAAVTLLFCTVFTATAVLENSSTVSFIKQSSGQCKSTSLAMALNLIAGYDKYTPSSLGGGTCVSIDGLSYTGSDGILYTATYKTDSYIGSKAEEAAAIETGLNNNAPVVAAVHSTSGGTQHHWVLVIGKSGGDYLIADPAQSGSGTIYTNVKTMTGSGYALGLADYSSVHYGYISFTASVSTANSASQSASVTYFAKCASSCTTITEGLEYIGAESSYTYRVKIASANGISGYSGTAAQNNTMLALLKAGTLIVPKIYFSKCASSCTTITEGLEYIGAESSYTYRVKIASANGISGYYGTAAQNNTMLTLLKAGTLIMP